VVSRRKLVRNAIFDGICVAGTFKNRLYLLNFPSEYIVGGKTGTAQIADPSGGYYGDKYNGTYMGFVGGDKPQYVIVVRVNSRGGRLCR
jgi:cell division protein FtsI (penicillin-binding protein 3)